jgi:hypothetical protein
MRGDVRRFLRHLASSQENPDTETTRAKPFAREDSCPNNSYAKLRELAAVQVKCRNNVSSGMLLE